MFEKLMDDFYNNNISIENILISSLIDEFSNLYSKGTLSLNEQIDCLGFINTLFRLKHKFIIDFNKEKRSYSRDMQMFHLKKIQRMAGMRIKKVKTPTAYKKYEASENVMEFKSLISALNKKVKQDITKKTRMLLDELMKERWTVQDKANLLKDILNSKDARFQDILESQDKEEIITSFLALLDLKRKEEIIVTQERNFAEIVIKRNK